MMQLFQFQNKSPVVLFIFLFWRCWMSEIVKPHLIQSRLCSFIDSSLLVWFSLLSYYKRYIFMTCLNSWNKQNTLLKNIKSVFETSHQDFTAFIMMSVCFVNLHVSAWPHTWKLQDDTSWYFFWWICWFDLKKEAESCWIYCFQAMKSHLCCVRGLGSVSGCRSGVEPSLNSRGRHFCSPDLQVSSALYSAHELPQISQEGT